MAFQFARGVHLQRTDENVDEIDALADLVGGRAGVDGVLEDLDRQGRSTWVPGFAVDHGFKWNREDVATRRWWPQGITTSADASDTEDIGGRKVIATSWYSKKVDGIKQGSRISFVDLHTLRYRHVLLVQPVLRDGRVDLEPLNVHAGGIVWCGPYLHVAGTARGLFTCRLDDIVRVPDEILDPDADRIGHGASRLATYGYRYLLPVRFSYRAHSDEGFPRMRYSFLSLDRSGPEPRLVAGEYGLRQQTTRLASYPLDPETFHLHSGDDGFSRPLLLEDRGERGMQGAAVVDGTWYLTSSRTPYGLGALYVGKPGAFRVRRLALPFGPEDITYWPSMDTFWSVTEHPYRRWVYAMNRRQFH